MEKYTLQAQQRTSVGRKVKKLRQTGHIPGTIYGKKIKSVTVAVEAVAFGKLYEKAGESALIELVVDGKVRPVLIHNVQKSALTEAPLHVEFFQVDLKEKVKTKVPLKFTGDSQAVSQKLGVLLTIIDEVEVEALPTELPEHITVSITELKALGEEIKVADLKVPAGVTILTDAELTVIKIGALVTKEAEAEAKAEEVAAAATATEAGAAATEEAAGEGSVKPDEGVSTTKSPESKKPELKKE